MKLSFGWISVTLIMETSVLQLVIRSSLNYRWIEDGKRLPLFGRKTELKSTLLSDGVTTRQTLLKSWWMPYFFLRHGDNIRDEKTIIIKDGQNYMIDVDQDEHGWNLKSQDGVIATAWNLDEVTEFVEKIKAGETVVVKDGKLLKS